MKYEFEALKKDFDRDGFVVVPDILDAETIENLLIKQIKMAFPHL